jgi:hypothetical protein
MTILKRESIPPFTARFVETTISGAGYSLLSGFPFVFSPARVSVDSVSDNRRQGNLPDELVFKESSTRVSVDSESDNRRQGNLPDELVFKESSTRVSVDSVSENRRQGNLPDELIIEESYNVTRDDGIYHVLMENASEREVLLQQGCILGTIEMGRRLVCAVREEIAQDLDTGKGEFLKTLDEASIELALASIDERFRPQIKKLLTRHANMFVKGDR